MYITDFSLLAHNSSIFGPLAAFTPWGDYWCAKVQPEDFFDPSALGKVERRYYEKLDSATKIAVALLHRLTQTTSLPDLLVLGSARGATGLLEQAHSSHLLQARIPAQTSPLTTAGNLASSATWVLGLNPRTLTVSMTCSSALHAIIIALEKLASGSCQTVFAGGVEAPVTSFTRAQFEALRLLSRHEEDVTWPCKPFAGDDRNRVVLAEGGALFALSQAPSRFRIVGWGESAERVSTPVGMASRALRNAMEMAINRANCSGSDIDLIMAHAPGTALGDPEELRLTREVCGRKARVVSGKWLTGHTLGASGAVALAQAMQAMEHGFPELPYTALDDQGERIIPKRVLVNATGFGGNASSVIVERCD